MPTTRGSCPTKREEGIQGQNQRLQVSTLLRPGLPCPRPSSPCPLGSWLLVTLALIRNLVAPPVFPICKIRIRISGASFHGVVRTK